MSIQGVPHNRATPRQEFLEGPGDYVIDPVLRLLQGGAAFGMPGRKQGYGLLPELGVPSYGARGKRAPRVPAYGPAEELEAAKRGREAYFQGISAPPKREPPMRVRGVGGVGGLSPLFKAGRGGMSYPIDLGQALPPYGEPLTLDRGALLNYAPVPGEQVPPSGEGQGIRFLANLLRGLGGLGRLDPAGMSARYGVIDPAMQILQSLQGMGTGWGELPADASADKIARFGLRVGPGDEPRFGFTPAPTEPDVYPPGETDPFNMNIAYEPPSPVPAIGVEDEIRQMLAMGGTAPFLGGAVLDPSFEPVEAISPEDEVRQMYGAGAAFTGRPGGRLATEEELRAPDVYAVPSFPQDSTGQRFTWAKLRKALMEGDDSGFEGGVGGLRAAASGYLSNLSALKAQLDKEVLTLDDRIKQLVAQLDQEEETSPLPEGGRGPNPRRPFLQSTIDRLRASKKILDGKKVKLDTASSKANALNTTLVGDLETKGLTDAAARLEKGKNFRVALKEAMELMGEERAAVREATEAGVEREAAERKARQDQEAAEANRQGVISLGEALFPGIDPALLEGVTSVEDLISIAQIQGLQGRTAATAAAAAADTAPAPVFLLPQFTRTGPVGT